MSEKNLSKLDLSEIVETVLGIQERMGGEADIETIYPHQMSFILKDKKIAEQYQRDLINLGFSATIAEASSRLKSHEPGDYALYVCRKSKDV